MSAVIIEGCAPWDGEYHFDDFAFTNRELYDIRKISDVRAAELVEAINENDTAVFVALALVVAARNNTRIDIEDLWNAKVGSIKIRFGDPEANGDEPDPQQPVEPENDTPGSGDGSTGDGV